MTAKEFFKSKTFLCIIVLLCIALVAGALLSIMNDLLYVSAEERVARTVKNIYGKEVDYDKVYVIDEEMKKPESERVFYQYKGNDSKGNEVAVGGHIDNVYRIKDDGNYLIKATGFQGYKQGSVSIWCVAVFNEGTFEKIDNVVVADYEKQTVMSKFTKSVLSDHFTGSEAFAYVESGATYSSVALNNALNAVSAYAPTLEGGAE